MGEQTSADETSLDTELPDRRMTPEEISEIVSSYSGFSGWLMRHPIVTLSIGAISAFAWGVILLITNPAGISTSGDEYGPSAPLQAWVLILALLCLALSGLCGAMFVVIIRHRSAKRRGAL